MLSPGRLVPSKPKALVHRLPRTTTLELTGKVWGKGDMAGTKYYVHRRFFDDVKKANAQA